MATPSEIKIRIIAKDEASKAFKRTEKATNSLRSAALKLKVAFAVVGIGSVAFGKSAIQTAAGVESLKLRLQFLTGTAAKAGLAFKQMDAYASQVPFALEEIQAATGSLLTVTKDVGKLNEILTITGDIAAAHGLTFVEVSQQIQRAFASGINSAEIFKERGISKMLGFQAGVSYSAEKTRKIITEQWAEGTNSMVGATEAMAGTYFAQISMMQDAWFKLKLAFADTGLLEESTQSITELTELLKDPAVIDGAKTVAGALLGLFKFIVANAETIMTVGAIYFGASAAKGLGKLVGGKNAAVATGVVAISSALYLLIQAMNKTEDQADKTAKAIKEVMHPLYSSGPAPGIFVKERVGRVADFTTKPFVEDPEVTRNREVMDSLKEQGEAVKESIDPWRGYRKEVAQLDVLLANHVITQSDYSTKKKILTADTVALIPALKAESDALEDLKEKFKFVGLEMTDIAVKGMNTLEDSLFDIVSGAKSAKDAFANMAKSIISDLLRMSIQQNITRPLFAMMGGMFGASAEPFDPGPIPNGNGGGFTGLGSRSGGVDGKGGFNAILHPNETVIDHTKGQGSGGAVNVTLNISTGVAQTVRAELSNLMPAITEATKAGVLEARQRGGSYSRALAGI